MTYFRKQTFSEMILNVPSETFGINQSHFYDAGTLILNGSKHKPLRHSEHEQKAQAFISKNKRNGFNLNKLLVPESEDVFSNQLKILIFKMRVFLYFEEKYRLKSRYNIGDTLVGTLTQGFKFNAEYKKRIQADTREFLKGQTDYVYQDFPAEHLLPWIDEDPIDDVYVFRDPLPITKRTLERTVGMMHRQILDGALLRDLDVIDALYLLDQKKTNHLDSKGRTKTNFEARGDELDISYPDTPILDYLFKKVTTDACTSRVAGIMTVKGRNLAYAAHSNLDKITMSDYDKYKEGLEYHTYVNSLSSDEGHFIMIDFKKSGLTTNREVIKSVYRVAAEHYPGYKPFAYYLECLENVIVNGLDSKRGTSLGMDDNCISFFLSCSFEAWLENRPHYKKSIDWAKFKGDDQVIKTNCDLRRSNDIFRSWIKCLQHQGFLINAKKSFVGKVGQFCEIVGRGRGIDNKAIQFGLNCFDALGCYNMVEFKIYLNALSKANENIATQKAIFDFCMTSVINSVAPEFCPEERIAPFEMGGYFSDYESSMNTFIVNCLDGKYKDHPNRLFRLIGWDFPKQSWSWRRKKDIITTEFKDVKTMFDKLKKFACPVLSKGWKDSFDACLEQRSKMYHDTKPYIVGAKLQKLVDFKANYALPLEFLERVGDDRFIAYVPPARRRQYKGKQLREQGKSNQLIKVFDKKYYYIDEIRAKLLLNSVETNEKFGINYYGEVPMSTIIWSLCKKVARSKWAIPIDWADWINQHEVDVDRVWGYYRGKGINLYHYKIRSDIKPTVSLMFRGSAHADLLTFCPYTGFPIRFNSSDYVTEVYERKIKTAQMFYLDLAQTYYRDFMFSHQMLMAWWGNNYKNKPYDPKLDYDALRYTDPDVKVRMDYYPGQEWCPEGVDVEVFFWYYEHYLAYEQDIDISIKDAPNLENWDSEAGFIQQENEGSESYGSVHNSDSDEVENFFRENPLDSADEEAENPYLHESHDTDEESG
jgi:hypothetical protein